MASDGAVFRKVSDMLFRLCLGLELWKCGNFDPGGRRGGLMIRKSHGNKPDDDGGCKTARLAMQRWVACWSVPICKTSDFRLRFCCGCCCAVMQM